MTNRRKIVDMSPNAIDLRMQELSELYELGVAIRSAKRLGPLKEVRKKLLEGKQNKRLNRPQA